MTVRQVQTSKEVEEARELFREYQSSIGVDLCFQDFAGELAALPGEYTPPSGRLLLCYSEDDLAGCVALRRINATTCEMKRLYVRPAFRGKHLGRKLTEAIIHEARAADYSVMKLDTLSLMSEAIKLYTSLGFKTTEPYRHNPIPGALFHGASLESVNS